MNGISIGSLMVPKSIIDLLCGTWYCDAENRIYMVQHGTVWTERGQDEVLRALLFDMNCYGSVALETRQRHNLALVGDSLWQMWAPERGFYFA